MVIIDFYRQWQLTVGSSVFAFYVRSPSIRTPFRSVMFHAIPDMA